MYPRDSLKKIAEDLKDKKATLGRDINLDEFEKVSVQHAYLQEQDLQALSQEEKKQLVMAGIEITEEERGGTFFQKDTTVVRCGTRLDGIEVIPITEALEHYDWIGEYYWKLLSPATDKYTAAAELDLQNGYVIRALPGAKSTYPIQACLYMEKEGIMQNVHNIIVAEEDSELHIITGCTTSPHLKRGLHIGVSEFYVKKNATLSFTMVHNWAENVFVRPRSAASVDEGGVFLNNYICMKPVKSLQMYPTTYLSGDDAVARYYSIIVGSPGSEHDIGGRIFLKNPGAKAEIVSRAISNGGKIIARGDLIGEVPNIKAHLECKGLILNGGVIHAIPELEGQVEGVEMSHEAAVGKIAQEEIAYLMSRGLSEDEATSTIVRGFLNVDIPGLPPQLKAEIDRAIASGDKNML